MKGLTNRVKRLEERGGSAPDPVDSVVCVPVRKGEALKEAMHRLGYSERRETTYVGVTESDLRNVGLGDNDLRKLGVIE